MSRAKVATTIALVAICVAYTTPLVEAESEIHEEPKAVLIAGGEVVSSPKGTEKLQTADSFSLGHYAYGHGHGHGQVHHAHATPYYANHYTYAKYLVPTVPYTPAYYSYHYPTYGYGHGHGHGHHHHGHHHHHASYPGYHVPVAHHPHYLPHHHHGYHQHGYHHGHTNYYGHHHHHPHHLAHGHSLGVPVYNTRFHRFGLYH